jgi:ATP-dependent RNA helicase DDX42
VGQIRAERQTLLFSATLPRKVEHLIRDVLSDPIRMTVGEVRTAMQKLRIVRLGFGTS